MVAPEEGRVARWIDLKAEGIGYNRPLDALWDVIAGELKSLDVIPAQMPAHTGHERILDHVYAWLDGDQRRRVVLLLDEADRFLESDGKEAFVRSSALKGLMDRTQRRFKIVFAGLHNVQRTTRQENQPLAHYGEPICIGPMLEHAEWREARRLIEVPLETLGYQFETPDLVDRILWQTNYYPSLIQLYCKRLLEHVSSPAARFDWRKGPPFVIKSDHLEDAYRNLELRKAIRDRFVWTLDLDPRYRVIALAIASYTHPDSGEQASEGFPVAWIREQAVTFWREGFRDSLAEDSLRVLLDEMIGLGVLRATNRGGYALRSYNVASLIGTREEIDSELLSSATREPPPTYEPATFRAVLRSRQGGGNERRSPLTVQQDSQLREQQHGVVMLFGCRAAGLCDIKGVAESSYDSKYLLEWDDLPTVDAFAKRLDDLGRRNKEGATLVHISHKCSWDGNWVQLALEKAQALTSKTAIVRLLFVADPRRTWDILRLSARACETSLQQGARLIQLSAWDDPALRQWLDDCGFAMNSEQRRQVSTVTGRWPRLLYELHSRSQGNQSQWEARLREIDQMTNEGKHASDLARDFGFDCAEPMGVLRDIEQLGEAPLATPRK